MNNFDGWLLNEATLANSLVDGRKLCVVASERPHSSGWDDLFFTKPNLHV